MNFIDIKNIVFLYVKCMLISVITLLRQVPSVFPSVMQVVCSSPRNEKVLRVGFKTVQETIFNFNKIYFILLTV